MRSRRVRKGHCPRLLSVGAPLPQEPPRLGYVFLGPRAGDLLQDEAVGVPHTGWSHEPRNIVQLRAFSKDVC